MVDLEVPFVRDEELAQQARERIEASIARLGGDSAAFWHAVALIYRRGLPDPGLGQAGSETVGSLVVEAGANPLLASVAASLSVRSVSHAAEGLRAPP